MNALLGSILLMLISLQVWAEESATVHEKVQAALDYSLPENPCTAPKAPGSSKQIRDDNGVTRTEWDVDSYTLARYERKEKRWKKCVDKYKRTLVKDQDTLKNSAQYGLTQAQAKIILSKIKLIQDILLSPSGSAPEMETSSTQ